VRLGERRFRKNWSGERRRGSEPVFVDGDIELVVRGESRHSRQEVGNGGQEIAIHRDWDRGEELKGGTTGGAEIGPGKVLWRDRHHGQKEI